MGQGLSHHGLRHRQVELLMKTIQMTQGSCILEYPLGFTPGLTLELSARLVELRLSLLSTREMT
jgi:hypothetical protein